jgi:hypothetical protein
VFGFYSAKPVPGFNTLGTRAAVKLDIPATTLINNGIKLWSTALFLRSGEIRLLRNSSRLDKEVIAADTWQSDRQYLTIFVTAADSQEAPPHPLHRSDPGREIVRRIANTLFC